MRWLFVALVAALAPTAALAQQVESSKLKAGGVFETIDERAAKLNSYGVFSGSVDIWASKLNAYAVMTADLTASIFEPTTITESNDILPGGGGGGGAAGLYGIGEDGEGATLTGLGGYGGAADLDNVPRQTTAGATGIAGTEFYGVIGAGSGAGGGDYGFSGDGQAGGTGGTYGGGGAGGGGASLGFTSGAGGFGGEGVIFWRYRGAGGVYKTIILDKDSGSTWTVPADWSNINTLVMIGAGGCGSGGSNTHGGNGGYGGDAIGGYNVNVFAPGQIVAIDVASAADACFGIGSLVTALGPDWKAGAGLNGDGTGGGATSIIGGADATGPFARAGGTGGPGGRYTPIQFLGNQMLIHRVPLTHFW